MQLTWRSDRGAGLSPKLVLHAGDVTVGIGPDVYIGRSEVNTSGRCEAAQPTANERSEVRPGRYLMASFEKYGVSEAFFFFFNRSFS